MDHRDSKKLPKLTTTSYAILGLLGLRPHSPYELAQQMSRSRVYWSAADSVVYDEPKKLASMGLVTSTVEANGKRTRTVYKINVKGRRELTRWLQEPGAGPEVEFEAMLKVLFADSGDKDSLVGSIAAIRAWALDSKTRGVAIARDYLDGSAPYPDRAHIVSLTLAYQWEFIHAALRWADFAESQVGRWDDTQAHTDPDMSLFERIVGEATDS